MEQFVSSYLRVAVPRKFSELHGHPWPQCTERGVGSQVESKAAVGPRRSIDDRATKNPACFQGPLSKAQSCIISMVQLYMRQISQGRWLQELMISLLAPLRSGEFQINRLPS